MLITFDLDGVLIKNPFMEGVFPEVKEIIKKQFIDKNGFKAGLEKEIWKMVNVEHVKRMNSNKPYLAFDWDGVIQQVAQDMGCAGGIDIAALVKKYCKHPYIKCINNPYQILNYLKEEAVRLLVVTNGYYRYQYPVLQALDLDKYFEEIITPEKIKSMKPDKEIFLKAYQGEEKWYHVGDTLSHDIYGANQVGALSVWIVNQLPDSLKKLDPTQRSNSDEGVKFYNHQLQEEINQNVIFKDFSPRNIKPNYIIDTLDELNYIIS